MIGLARVLGKIEIELHSSLHGLRINLRQVGVDPQGIDRLQVE
jgi:hypothetical protein